MAAPFKVGEKVCVTWTHDDKPTWDVFNLTTLKRGETGTVLEVTDPPDPQSFQVGLVLLDEHHEGLKDWDNTLQVFGEVGLVLLGEIGWNCFAPAYHQMLVQPIQLMTEQGETDPIFLMAMQTAVCWRQAEEARGLGVRELFELFWDGSLACRELSARQCAEILFDLDTDQEDAVIWDEICDVRVEVNNHLQQLLKKRVP